MSSSETFWKPDEDLVAKQSLISVQDHGENLTATLPGRRTCIQVLKGIIETVLTFDKRTLSVWGLSCWTVVLPLMCSGAGRVDVGILVWTGTCRGILRKERQEWQGKI